MRIDLFVTPRRSALLHQGSACGGRRHPARLHLSLLRAQSGVEQVIPVDSVEGQAAPGDPRPRHPRCSPGGRFNAGPQASISETRPLSSERRAGRQDRALCAPERPPLLTRSMEAVEKVLLSFVNMAPMVRYLTEKGDSELTVICGGYDGRFAMEDVVAAGMLIDLMGKGESELLNDGARAAWILYLAHRRDLSAMIRESAAGRALLEQGLDADLEEAIRLGAVDMVPVAREGRITAA
ncbi:MAG: 2-phosphosulfolactate phosphatase [Candidatus Eisenbacteria bacterium]